MSDKFESRIRLIKQVVETFESGGMSAVKAVSTIEDIASGEHERVVHVGNIHNPEIQS